MASSVLHTNGDSLSSASQPTITGDFTYCIWVKCNAGEYGGAGDQSLFGWGITGGSSEGFGITVLAASNTQLTAFVFRAGGGEQQNSTILTGSSTVWVCIAIRHTSGSASYDVSHRLENATTWTTDTLTLTTQLTSAGSVFIGDDQFGEPAVNSDTRHFFCQATRMSDATLLTASQNINSAPAGTNLHWLRLLDAASAATNGGTAGNWTVTGTLQTASTEPTEAFGPTINTQPQNVTTYVGNTANFTVSATTSGGTLTYQWKLNGSNVTTGSGGTTASYTTDVLAFSDNGNSYTCVVSDDNGSTTSSAAILTLYIVPALMWVQA